MIMLVPIAGFLTANLLVLVYGQLSAQITTVRGLFLLPLVWFPLIYIVNVSFSAAFHWGAKAHLSIPTLFLLHIGGYVLLLWLGNVLVWKQAFPPLQLLGIALLLTGIVLVLVGR